MQGNALKSDQELPTRVSSPRALFDSYVKNRCGELHLRLIFVAVSAFIVFHETSLHMVAWVLFITAVGEWLDYLYLRNAGQRLAMGGKLSRELRMSYYTAAIQSASVAAFFVIAGVVSITGPLDFFVLIFLLATVTNAGMVMHLNRIAGLIRVVGYSLAGAVYLVILWVNSKNNDLALELTISAAVVGYISYRLIGFANASFLRQSRDAAAWRRMNANLSRAYTDIKAKEVHLRRLAAVAEHANDNVLMFDASGKIIWVNHAFERTSGYTADEVVGREPADVLHGPLTSSETVMRLREAIEEGRPVRTEILNYTKSGQQVWMETNLVPIPAQGGGPMMAIAVERNITHSKTRQDELTRAKRDAEQSEKDKSRFLATMSYEIRTPMNGIIGMADVLAEEELTDSARVCVTSLQDSAQSLLRIVNDILDLSKLEAGKLGIEPVVFDLPEFFTKLEATLRPRAEAKGLRLNFEVTENPPMVMGDEGRIRQILTNLVDNAIKFTEKGGVTVSVQAIKMAQTCRLAVDVSDSGIGISPDAMSSIFGYYQQADDSTTRRFGGTGLGLAISRQLANQMGGDLTVVSSEGEGSCFSLFLPLPCAVRRPTLVASTAAPVASAPLKPLASYPALKGRRVLVAEDNKTNRILVEKFLSGHGLDLHFAEDGVQAHEMAETLRPEVVLMDMSMPRMDGMDATRRIRKLSIPQPYIIALTANALQDDRDTCINAGMDDFLSKPVRKVDLLRRLSDILESRPPLNKAL